MNSLLLWIGGLLVAVLGLLFAAPLVIDWNSYRGVLEEEATRILGRDVRVGGKVDLRLLPSPYVRFEKVRISDAGAALGEPFFRAESFTLWLSPTPLLRGALEATELELDRPVLRLAVDAEGRGNWQALRITPGSVPFVPSDVVLQQVRVRQGVVSLKTPSTAEPLTLTGIEGEVAAASLDGPFRFRGTVDWYGAPRELRINTAQREADGKLRYKASIRVPESANQYALDGTLSELSVKARNIGTLTAKLPVAGLIPAASGERGRPRSNEVVDLSASFDGDLEGVRLDNLAFAFEHEGKPQLMSGSATANWRNGIRMETRLASRWLDLDQLAGQSAAPDAPRAPPVDLLRQLIGQVSGALPREGASLLTVDVDQVNLGGAALSGVRLALARTAGLTSIGELKASLPGNSRGELRGTIGTREASPGSATAETFDGELVLRGASVQRFAAWAGAGAWITPGLAADAPFSLTAKLKLTPDAVALSGVNAELAGKQAGGAVDWNWGKARRLDVQAEGRTIDIGPFSPGVLDLTGSGSPEQTALSTLAQRVAAINRSVGTMKLQVRAGELTDGTTTYRNVDADLEVRDNGIVINSLRGGGGGDARIELQGQLTALSSRPAGTLRGWIGTDSQSGLDRLTRILPDGGRTIAHRLLRDRERLETSITLELGAKPDERLTLAAAGTLDQTRHDITLQLDGGPNRWREAPLALAMSLDGPAAADALRRLAFAEPARADAAGMRAGRFHIDAAGANASALVANARLELPGAGSAIYRGRARIAPDAGLDMSGDIALTASDAGELAAFAIGSRRPAIGTATASGNISLERAAGVIDLASANLNVGGTMLRGKARLSEAAGRSRIESTVVASHLDIPTLLGFALDGSAAPVESGAETSASLWSAAPFALNRFAAVEGQITITAPLARLGDDLTLEGAEARIGLSPGRIELSSLTGAALGGRFTARGTLERADGGAVVALDARLTGALLDRISGADGRGRTKEQAVPSGAVNLTFLANGRSLSPRTLISAVSGKGEVEFRAARAAGISPSLIERTADAALDVREDITRERLQAIIATEIARSDIGIGNRKLAIDIADGIAKVGALEITADEATVRNVTTIDLSALKADSEWQIRPRRPWKPKQSAKRGEPLSGMTLVWSGGIGTIARQSPRLSIESLERDLGLRRIEQETEKLEELRRQDEERVRLEQERQRQLQDSAPGSASPTPANVPVIEAPFRIQPSVQPQGIGSSGAAAQGPAPGGTPEVAPQPRIVRPPTRPPTPSRSQRTLQDVFSTGQ